MDVGLQGDTKWQGIMGEGWGRTDLRYVGGNTPTRGIIQLSERVGNSCGPAHPNHITQKRIAGCTDPTGLILDPGNCNLRCRSDAARLIDPPFSDLSNKTQGLPRTT